MLLYDLTLIEIYLPDKDRETKLFQCLLKFVIILNIFCVKLYIMQHIMTYVMLQRVPIN